MIRFLRLFAAYRSLEVRYKSQEGVIQNLQVKLDASEKESASLMHCLKMANDTVFKLSDAVTESHLKHVKATETVADFVSQLRYGRKIFDHAPELPEVNRDLPQPERKLKPQASDLVHEAERKFYAGLNKPKEPVTQ